MNWPILIPYLFRVLPAVCVALVALVCLPRRFLEFRICIYIGLFILLRDAMTPAGFWNFGAANTFWIRFFHEPLLLIVMGISTGLFVLGMNFFDQELTKLLIWKKSSWFSIAVSGIAGALLIAAPSFALFYNAPIEQRGGAVPGNLIFPLLIFSFIGNCYEEVLFRGYLQGFFEKKVSLRRAAILSGVAFSFGHIFLATTVTNVGWIILGFTLYEGLIAAILRMKFGLWASVIAHGGGIFLLASGLI